MSIDTPRAQRLAHTLTGHQGHFTFGRNAAIQHTDSSHRCTHCLSPKNVGKRLILPAPMINTTSSARTKFSKESASWSNSGTNTGSTDRKSTRLNSSHVAISYAVFCLKK